MLQHDMIPLLCERHTCVRNLSTLTWADAEAEDQLLPPPQPPQGLPQPPPQEGLPQPPQRPPQSAALAEVAVFSAVSPRSFLLVAVAPAADDRATMEVDRMGKVMSCSMRRSGSRARTIVNRGFDCGWEASGAQMPNSQPWTCYHCHGWLASSCFLALKPNAWHFRSTPRLGEKALKPNEWHSRSTPRLGRSRLLYR